MKHQVNMAKTYKKGLRIVLNCSTHDPQSKVSKKYTLESDYTEEQLDKLAEEFFWNQKEPSWWWEIQDRKGK